MTERENRPPLLVVGSRNAHKIEEIRAILAGLDLEIAGAELLPDGLDIAETGESFEANAAIKARGFAAALASRLDEPPFEGRRVWVLSDDSGLCVFALDDEPGVHSARYAAPTPDANADCAANNRKLLDELAGVPPQDRGAYFACAVVVVEATPDGPPVIVAMAGGSCDGVILEEARGSGGFGYDPLFLVPSLGRTFAELDPAEKNRMSHRAQALGSLRDALRELLGQSS